MTNASQADMLTQAFDLVEQDRLVQARNLVQTVLSQDSANADAWWVYAHAVEDPAEARKAVNRVLELDPTYPGAAQLSRELQTADVPMDDFFEDDGEDDNFELNNLQFNEEEPAFDADLSFEERDFDLTVDDLDLDDDFEAEVEDRPSLLRRLVILAVILLLVMIGVFILMSGGGDKDTTATPTQVAQNPTAIPTTDAGVSISPTVEPSKTANISTGEAPTLISDGTLPELTANAQSAEGLIALLDDFTLAEPQTSLIQTRLGMTEIVSICTTADVLRDTLDAVIPALGSNPDAIHASAQAVGVRLIDCGAGDGLLSLGTTVANICAFADGSMTPNDYVGSWAVME